MFRCGAALYSSSWPGFVPAIHVLMHRRFKDVDARDKPGHDDLNQLPRPYRCDTDVAELPQEKQP